MICNHTFIRINDHEKPRPSQGVSWNGMIAGAIAGCINCGQVRGVYEDGTVELMRPGGDVIDEDHASDTPA